MADGHSELGEVDILHIVVGGSVKHGSVLQDPTAKPLDLIVEAGLGDAVHVLALLDGCQESFAYLSE